MLFFKNKNTETTPRWVWKVPPKNPEVMVAEYKKKHEVSNRVKAWHDEIDTWAKEFMEKVDEDIKGEDALFQRSYTIGESRGFRTLMRIRLENTVKLLKARVSQLDQEHKTENDDQFDLRVEGILDDTQGQLYKLKDEVVSSARGIAALGGEDQETIDTKEEAWLLDQNLASFYEDIDTPAGRMKLQKKTEALLPQVKVRIGPHEGLITKIVDGVSLSAADYDNVLDGLSAVWHDGIQMKNKITQRDSLKMIERTGALLPVQVMSPAQRFALGERLVVRQPAEARRGILFLAHLSFLDLEQTQTLLERMGQPLAESDKETIQETRKAVEEAKKVFEKIYGKTEGSNLLLEHGTGSNFLIYEVTGRIAVAGAILPLVLNAGSPSKIPDILTDPAWLGCVGLAAGSFEHISGGLGQGVVTETILSIGDGPKAMTQAEAQNLAKENSRKKLDDLCGGHPETVHFLTANNGAVLEAIDTIALEKESGMDEGYYLFQFNDLIEYRVAQAKSRTEQAGGTWTEADAAAERARWETSYLQPRDGLSVTEVQSGIQGIYHVLAHELALTDIDAMQREINLSRTRRAVD